MQAVLFLAAFALGAAAQDLTVDTPTVDGVAGAAQCEPLLLSWSGGTPTYFVTVDTQPAGATHVVEFDNQSGNAVTWLAVNATAGTQLILTVSDATGRTKQSQPFLVTADSGSTKACLTSSTGGSNSAQNFTAGTILSTGRAGLTPNPSSQSVSSTSQSVLSTSSASSANTSSPAVQPGGQRNLAGPIAGGIVGGLVLVISVLAVFLCRTRRRRDQKGTLSDTEKELSQRFSTLPSGETYLTSLPSQIIPRGILAEEEKGRRRPMPPELHAPAEATLSENPNAQLLDEIRMLRQQMQAIEQRVQPQIQLTIPVMDQALADAPPEYTS